MAPSPDKAEAPPPWVAGVDDPRSYREFVEWFPEAAACSAYLERFRGPNGFVCPACRGAGVPWRRTRVRRVCSVCRWQTTVTVDTLLDETRTPLTTGFAAAFLPDSVMPATTRVPGQSPLSKKPATCHACPFSCPTWNSPKTSVASGYSCDEWQ